MPEGMEAGEQQTPSGEQAQEPKGFDWDAFWDGTDAESVIDQAAPPAPAAAAPPTPAEEYDDLDAAKVAKELAELRKAQEIQNAKFADMERQAKVDKAIAAWEEQATPAEKALSHLLHRSGSLEELKANEAAVRHAASRIEEDYKQREEMLRKNMERELQQEYGLPVPPTFSPPPREEKVKEQLDAGNLEAAADILLEGMFGPA